MDYAKIKEKAKSVIIPIVESLGYEVVDLECKYANKADNVTVYIYKKGGITLDDCEKVSGALDGPLDQSDISEGANYVLNVSSPGLDRPIVSDRDFERNIGEEVEAVFNETAGKKKKVVGTLESYDAENVILAVKTTKQTLKRAEIKELHPYINFKNVDKTQI